MKKKTTSPGREVLKNRIVDECGVEKAEVSKRLLDVCLLIEANEFDQITVSRHNALDGAVTDTRQLMKSVLKKYEDAKNGENFVCWARRVQAQFPNGRKKIELMDFLRSAFNLKTRTSS